MTESGLTILVDWVAVTLKKPLEAIYDILVIPPENFVDGKNGMHGYRKQKICGGIRILFDGGADMGCHVIFGGQGCREYETYYLLSGGWLELFYRLTVNEANFTRLDLSIDEIRYSGVAPIWTIDQVVEKARKKEVRTRFRRGKGMEEIYFERDRPGGKSFYFGSDRSLIQFVVYDKARERESAGAELAEDITTWNRFEMRLADDRAQTAVEWCLKGVSVGYLAFGIISNYLAFVEPTNDSNRARWPVSPWWLEYLSIAERLTLYKKPPDKTIDSKKAWLERQTFPTIAQVFLADGSPDLEDWASKLLHVGIERLSDDDLEMAFNYRHRKQQEEEELKEIRLREMERRHEEKRIAEEVQQRDFVEKVTNEWFESLD